MEAINTLGHCCDCENCLVKCSKCGVITCTCEEFDDCCCQFEVNNAS